MAERSRLPSAIREALDSAGQPWELKPKRDHFDILLGGRRIGSWPRHPVRDAGRGVAGMASRIRRAARELERA